METAVCMYLTKRNGGNVEEIFKTKSFKNLHCVVRAYPFSIAATVQKVHIISFQINMGSFKIKSASSLVV